MGGWRLTRCLGGHDRAHDLWPALEALSHVWAILGGREPVASRSDVLGDGTIRGEKPLGVPWQREGLPALLQLARGMVRGFRAVVEITMLAVLHTRPELRLAVPSRFS